MNELITKSLKKKDVQFLMDFPAPLMDELEIEIVDWIVEYSGRHMTTPQLSRVEKEFDTFIPIDSRDPISDLFEQTILSKKRALTNSTVADISAKISEDIRFDPTEYIAGLFEAVAAPTSNLVKFSTFDRTKYFRRTKNPLLFNMPLIDKATGGLVFGDLVYFVGRLGTGKTTITQWMANSWWREEKVVLVISNELMPADIMIKQDAMVGGFNPLDIRLGKKDREIIDKIKVVKHIARHSKGEIIVPQNRGMTPSDVFGLAHSIAADAILIDGVHLMRTADRYGSNWEKVKNITNMLKQNALESGIPCLGVSQLGRGAVGRKAEVEDIAYSDAMAQDADMVIGLTPDKKATLTLPKGVMQAEVDILKNRFGNANLGTSLRIDFNTMTVVDEMSSRL